MLKIRIIPILLWNGSTLAKGQNFINEKRSAGSPLPTIKIYNSRDVDEIIFFNISNNTYDRNYLRSKINPKIRCTVDSNIRYFKISL